MEGYYFYFSTNELGTEMYLNVATFENCNDKLPFPTCP